MKSVTVRTLCTINDAKTILAPGAKPGDNADASSQVRRINNVPDDMQDIAVLALFDQTADCTTPKRFEFDYSELGPGRIIQ